MTMWRVAWSPHSSLLALNEALFYQSSYNSVFLEQYSLLNRREPEPVRHAVKEDPDDPDLRV